MEHNEFNLRVKNKFQTHFKNRVVLDISLKGERGDNIDLFEDCNYLNIDDGILFEGPDNYFDTIISTKIYEDNVFYEESIKNIIRMTKKGGLVLFKLKNYEEKDLKKIVGFDEAFPDFYSEFRILDNQKELYFYGIKGGEKYITDNIKPEFDKSFLDGDIFVIDAWPNNKSKEDDLVELIKILKIYNQPILLCGHYPIKPEIQKMVDYYIFDKNNPLLHSHEFTQHDVASGRWTENSEYIIENEMEFHHDYAIWETMRNAFNFCKYLGKNTIHFLEYDNKPNPQQYRQAFLERTKDFDAILYEYSEGSSKSSHLNPYCATFIFSIKTDVAIKVIDQIHSKYDYFTNKPKGWQLERVFLDCLRKTTKNILLTSYIDNDGGLNTQAVWNRDGVNRNGATMQIYLGTDLVGSLYLHLISGFHEVDANSDYLLEVNYHTYKKFITLRKGEFILEKIGEYRKGDRVKVYHRGVEVFNEYLGDNIDKFYKKNKVSFRNLKIEYPPERIDVNYVDGVFVQIFDNYNVDREFDVKFIDKKTNNIIYQSLIKNGWWTKTSIEYFVDWKVQITSTNFNYDSNLDLINKRVLISFESKSLGDTLAWIPYVEEFRKKHDCHVICSTFHNELFKERYREIQFVNPGTTVDNIYAMYRIGLWFVHFTNNHDTNKHPSSPINGPLQKIASDILGLDYKELKPKLPKFILGKKKRVCIAVHSTAQAKYWNNPSGWQEIVDYLINKGYEVRLLSREEDGYMGNKNPKGVVQQPLSTTIELIKTLQESELFIGISSGLSWLSWASGTPTILISGFTDDILEPKEGIKRVINKNVCHGCWSTHKFDPGDWNWCPIHKNTPKQFECSKNITSNDVIKQIESILE